MIDILLKMSSLSESFAAGGGDADSIVTLTTFKKNRKLVENADELESRSV